MFLDVVMWHVVTFCIGRILQKFSVGFSFKDILTLRHQPSHCLTCFQKYLLLPCMYHSKSEANPIAVPTPSSNSRRLGRKQHDFSQHQKKISVPTIKKNTSIHKNPRFFCARGVFSFLSPAGFYIRWLEKPLYDTSSMRLDPEAYEERLVP